MADDNESARQDGAPETDPASADSWREDAREWYEELKGEEYSIAPWLSLEWTGERMRVRRG